MRILIVDIHPPTRLLIRTLVEDLAEAVIDCVDDATAAALYAAHQFGAGDRVLIDLEMPGDGGLEAVRRLHGTCPDVPIVVVMQYDDAYLREAALEAGACGTVLKGNLLALRDLLHGRPGTTRQQTGD